MILYVDRITYVNKENTKVYGLKHELRNEDNTKTSCSKNGLLVALRNFKRKYNITVEPKLVTGEFKKEIIDK